MVRAVLFLAGGALLAGAGGVPALARFILGADADPIADLQVAFGLGADAQHRADDFVAHAAGVDRRALSDVGISIRIRIRISVLRASWGCPKGSALGPRTLQESYPSTPQGVYVTAANPTADHLDVHVGLLPRLGGEFLPDHVAVGRGAVQAHPSLELFGCHFENIVKQKLVQRLNE